MCIKGFGNEVCFKMWYFYNSETDKTRCKRVSSHKTCWLRDQLVIDELGASCKLFLKNIVTRPVVLQYRYGFSFTIFF